MELCRGGELFDAITESGCFSEAKAMEVIRQVASALDYLHSHNVAHRDLKPENILYFDEERTIVKLMDFGLAKILDEDDITIMTRCGTLHYVAPEVLSKSGSYTHMVDMWSLGVVLYVLLCGYLPFYHDDRHFTAKLIRLGRYEYDPEEWEEISDEAKDLIDKLICLNVHERLEAKEVLEHPWMKGIVTPREWKLLSSEQQNNLRSIVPVGAVKSRRLLHRVQNECGWDIEVCERMVDYLLKSDDNTSQNTSRLKNLTKHSERFAEYNAKRHVEKLGILIAMQTCSIQLKRWMQTAADNVGQIAPEDPTPEVDYTE